MIQSSYPPAFPLKHQQKDMRLALALGDENAVSMPVAAAANEVLSLLKTKHQSSISYTQSRLTVTFFDLQAFKKARSMGLGDHDFSAVYEALKTTQDPSSA